MEKYYEDLSNLVEGDKRLLKSLELELKDLQEHRGNMPLDFYDSEYTRLFYHYTNTKLSLENNELELKRTANPLDIDVEEKIESLKKLYNEERDHEIRRELATEIERLKKRLTSPTVTDKSKDLEKQQEKIESMTEEQILADYRETEARYKQALKEYDDVQIKGDNPLGYTRSEIDEQISDYFSRRVESFKKLRMLATELKEKSERYKDVIAAHEEKDTSVVKYGNIKLRYIPTHACNLMKQNEKPGAAPIGVPVKKDNDETIISQEGQEVPRKIAVTLETHPELSEETTTIPIEEILSGIESKKQAMRKPLVAENIVASQRFCSELSEGEIMYNIIPNENERMNISVRDKNRDKAIH